MQKKMNQAQRKITPLIKLIFYLHSYKKTFPILSKYKVTVTKETFVVLLLYPFFQGGPILVFHERPRQMV